MCLHESVCTSLSLEKSGQRRQNICQILLWMHLKTDILLLAASMLFHAEMKHLQEVTFHFC